jgi:NADPH-dependent curcumin reductase CurA
LSAEKTLKDNVIKRLRARKCLSLLSPLSVGAWNNHQSYTKEDNQATILLKEARKRGFILKKKIIDTKK